MRKFNHDQDIQQVNAPAYAASACVDNENKPSVATFWQEYNACAQLSLKQGQPRTAV